MWPIFRDQPLMWGWSLRNDLVVGWRWVTGAVDQDEFAEVEPVGESLPFGLVQDALVVVVPERRAFPVRPVPAGPAPRCFFLSGNMLTFCRGPLT